MASLRDIRQRIQSVKNVSQVTKAMEAVAAARMRKAQAQVVATRPYAKQAGEVLSYVSRLPGIDGELASLVQVRPVKRTGILLITSDRGLAGGFNANVIRTAASFMREKRQEGAEVEVIAAGRKGRDWLLRYDPVIRAEFENLGDTPTAHDMAPVTRLVLDDYISGHFDEIYVIYTDFINTIRQEPNIHKLLPVEPTETSTEMAADYILEPSPEAVLHRVIHGFTEVQILQAMYESIASEHSARMVAMRNATDAANELIDTLTLHYNKARQASITSELMDIIGGSEALEKA